ncbi:non-heme iron oxygenase ferredoxin subunit [Variovorax paradoxus]|jgi:naphthalene 1,2-dioxygenase system ferredoxin subunit|uniref:non-heme iron oxygenase ferredoxin subunit n=1 Tax=Variovorax TaxID=34072 RepID=UPI001DD01ACF|nr:non-heme iron oxygenase ferredoxin subunit [Variovorax paradoxus]MBW8716875.1 non-heme iron oxygenase ferredoxin subunit [Variovorax paradoxus]
MSDSQWTEAAAVDEVPADDVVGMQVGGRDIALYNVDGQIYATDNVCTHGHARLCEGFLEGHEIECPLHQGKFDVRNGKPICAPVTEAIRSYPVRIEAGRVFLSLD